MPPDCIISHAYIFQKFPGGACPQTPLASDPANLPLADSHWSPPIITTSPATLTEKGNPEQYRQNRIKIAHMISSTFSCISVKLLYLKGTKSIPCLLPWIHYGRDGHDLIEKCHSIKFETNITYRRVSRRAPKGRKHSITGLYVYHTCIN